MENETLEQIKQTLISVMKARSPHDPAVRRIVLGHCQVGHTEVMANALAEYLVDYGISRSLLPAPTYPINTDLADRAWHAAQEMLLAYQDQGGTLVARRFVSIDVLRGKMLLLWKSREARKIAGTEDLPDYEKQHERIARATVAAQALKKLLDRYHAPGVIDTSDTTLYAIHPRQVEGFCMEAVKIMEAAYRSPDAWVAQKLNGGA